MTDNIYILKRNLRPFTKRAEATANGAANGTTIVSLLNPAAAEEGLGEPNDYWNDAQILILTGDMIDQVRRITDWNLATGTLTVDPRFINPHVSLLTANVLATAVIIPVADASVFSAGEAYIWDAANAETVTITLVDTVLNQLTIAAPGLVNPYTVAAGAAISMSPRILDGVQFTIMTATKTEDTGVHTNPEKWLHDNHWNPAAEVPLVAAGVPGQLFLGAAVAAGRVRRIREVTARHIGTNNTIVSVLDQAGGNVIISFNVPAQSTATWFSQDGRAVAATLQPVVQTSDVTGGGTTISAAGVEAQ